MHKCAPDCSTETCTTEIYEQASQHFWPGVRWVRNSGMSGLKGTFDRRRRHEPLEGGTTGRRAQPNR